MNISFNNLIRVYPRLDSDDVKVRVDEFCKTNRIFGGSFAIMSKRFERPFLLFSTELKKTYNLDPDIDFYQYLNTPYNSIFEEESSNKYFIDFLFYIFRMGGIPEYVTRLNQHEKSKFEFPFQETLRKENKILHCSTGEMLFFLCSWRIVIKKLLRDIPDDKILSYFDKNKLLFPSENKFHEIYKTEVVESNNEIEPAIERNLKDINHLKNNGYLKDLGLNKNPIFEEELNHYLAYLNPKSEEENKNNFNEDDFKHEDNFIEKLLVFFQVEKGVNELTELLKEIHSNSRFPILPYYYIYKFDIQNRRKDHLVKPVWWTYTKETRYLPEIDEVLHCLYTLNPLIDDNNWYTEKKENLSILSRNFEKYLVEFNNFFKDFVNPIIDQEYYSKQRTQDIKDLKRNSIKSSLAAVMSRNMSHNIGSHVLNKLSEKSLVDDFFKDNNYLFKGSNTDNQKTANQVYTLSPFFPNNIEAKTSSELGRVFNDYLKKRMDFVADVATTDKALLTNNKMLFGEVFRNFERNLLMLQNISGKDEEFRYKFNFQISNSKETVNINDTNKFLKFYDPVVSMPNDVLGDQAFYIMLENIIRNTAKHSGAKDEVTFTIKVNDSIHDDFYIVSIYDDVEYDENELVKLVYDRNNSIAKGVLDENNEIRKNGWGTIELKLAACYLSGISTYRIEQPNYNPIGLLKYESIKEDILKRYNDLSEQNKQSKEDIDIQILNDWWSYMKGNEKFEDECPQTLKREIKEGTFRIPILQAIDGNIENDNRGFGYTFLMKKPKEVLIYDPKNSLDSFLNESEGNEQNNSNETIKTQLSKLGVNVVTALKTNKVYSHHYLIVIGDENTTVIGDNEVKTKIKEVTNLPHEIYFIEGNNNDKLSYWDYKKDKLSEYIGLTDIWKFDLIKSLRETLKKKQTVELKKFLNICFYLRNDKIQFPLLSNDNQQFTLITYNRLQNYVSLNKKHREADSMAIFSHHSFDALNDYTEAFGSSSNLGFYTDSLLEKAKSDIRNSTTYFLQQATSTKVVVIDERIQSSLDKVGFVSENKDSTEELKINNDVLFEKMNIAVPTKDNGNFDLHNTRLNLETQKVFDYIDTECKEAEYLIIHFGIIESLRGNEYESVEAVLEKIKKVIARHRCKLVITSGRGYTPDIRALQQFFLPYSTLSNLLLDRNNRSKPHLVRLLKSLRNIKLS